MSADPIIQTIQLSQALNPYSYAMNMPLTLIDPSGYSWLSKLFHNIGHLIKKIWKVALFGLVGLLPDKWIRAIVSLELAILLPGLGPMFQGFWGTVLTGAISGGVATGSWQGAIAGAVFAGTLFGLGKIVHVMSNPLDNLPKYAAAGQLDAEAMGAYTGQTIAEVTLWGNRMTSLEKRLYDLSHLAGAAASYLGGKANQVGREYVGFAFGWLDCGIGSSTCTAGQFAWRVVRVPASAASGLTGEVATGVGQAIMRSDFARGIMVGSFRVTGNAVVNAADILEVEGAQALAAAEAFEQSVATRIEAQIAEGKIPWPQGISGR